MSGRALSRLGVALAVCTASARVHAQPAVKHAILLLPSCPIEGVNERRVRDLLEVELRADGIQLAAPGAGLGRDDALLEVRSTCQADAPLVMRGSFGDAEQTRELGLTDLPGPARTRALALSLAELLEQLEKKAQLPSQPSAPEVPPATNAAEPGSAEQPRASVENAEQPVPGAQPSAPSPGATPPPSAPQPKTPSAETSPSRTEPVRAAGPPSRVRLLIAPEVRWFAPNSPSGGARAVAESGRAAFGLAVLAARSVTDAGQISATLVHGLFGWSLLDTRSSDGALSAGARVGLGLLTLGAQPFPGAVASVSNDPYLDAAVFGRAELDLSGGFWLGAEAEAGLARGATALLDSRRIANYSGFFLGGTLRLGYQL